MSRGSSVVKNTGILMFMELGIRILDAVVAVILARYLSPQGFGLFSFAISFAWLFSILPGFGMGSLVTRDLSRQPEEASRYLANGLLAKVLLALLTLVLMIALSLLLGYSPERLKLVFLAGILMIFETNVRFVLSFFQAARRMTVLAVTNLAVRFGWLFVSLLVIWQGGGLAELLGVRTAVSVAGLAAVILLVHFTLQKIRWRFDPAFVWTLLKSSFPFALFRLYGKVYIDIDTVMLSTMRGDVMTGWYAAAHRVLRVFTFIPSSFFGAVLPEVSRFARDSRDAVSRAIAQSAKYLSLIALPLAAGGFVLADQAVLILYGAKYAAAVPALQILIWSVFFVFMNSAMVAGIAAVNREREGSRYLIFGALFSGLSNLIVIPLFGHLGAASTTLLAEAFIFSLQVRLLKRELGSLGIFRALARPALAAGLMMGSMWLLREPFGWIAALLSGPPVYLACLWRLRVLSPEEWRVFVEVLKREKRAPAVEVLLEKPPRADLKMDSKTGITVHCRVRNEERFVKAAVQSVLPVADRVLVYDTGSTDRTLEEIASIQDNRIEIVRKPPSDARGIMEYRNEMIERTDTEWFFQVDGDEVYPPNVIERIREEIPKVPPHVHRIVINRKHFIKNFNFISPTDSLGRIYRAREIRWKLFDPSVNEVGHETPFLPQDPLSPLTGFSLKFPADIYFFHLHHLSRSSKDAELGVLRRWRKLPFPAKPYFGPWPEVLDVNGSVRLLNPKIYWDLILLNTRILWTGMLHSRHKIKRGIGRLQRLKILAQGDHAPD